VVNIQSPNQTKQTPAQRSPWGIVLLCGGLILADGYDLIVYGNVVPSLLAEPGWNMTPALAGQIGSIVLLGMLIGALLAGTLSDRIGRRKLIIIAVVWFSIAMAACALAPSALAFGAFRAIGGLGLGALFPVVTAMIMEFAPQSRKAIAYSFTLFGYLAGGILAGVLGLLLINSVGWRSMFWIGALPLLLVPVVIKMLPESPAWLAARGEPTKAQVIATRFGISIEASPPAKSTVGAIFRDGLATRTLLAWAIQFCSLLLVFGMVNWLPTIMVSLGYNLQSALLFSVVLNVGAAAGAVVGSRFADRGALAIVVVVLFLLGTASVAALSAGATAIIMFLLVALAGAGTLGTQILVNVLVASIYPPNIRGTGLGWALAVGRLGGILGPLIGGALLSAGLVPQASFWVFAGVGAIGAVLTVPFVFYAARARKETANA
jgi:AAHS family benzoate transporter-like MFS transporter